MTYSILKILYMPKLFHNIEQKRRVKAFQVHHGLFAHRIPNSKDWRISHLNGLCLPEYYKNRKQALQALTRLQVKDWTNYKENRDKLLALYKIAK